MDKIIEELFTNLIKRIENIESRINTTKDFKSNQEATPGQIRYIRGLGGKVWANMSKEQARKYIDNLLHNRVKKDNSDGSNEDYLGSRNKSEEEKKDEHMSEFEDTQPEPLTEEEIKEIGEENLL